MRRQAQRGDVMLAYRRSDTGAAPRWCAADWWVVISWGCFGAVSVLVLVGYVWLQRSRRADGGEAAAILYPLAVGTAGIASLLSFGATAVFSVFAGGRRRRLLKALVPWTLSIASCGAVFVIGAIVDAMKR